MPDSNNSSSGNAVEIYNDPAWYHASMLLAILAIILLISSCIANTLLTAAIAKFPKLRSNFNFYLLNMAISDILFAIFAMSNFSATMYYGYYPFGFASCTFWLYSDWIFSAATENIMMLVSLDRLVCVYWPIFYRNKQKSGYALIIVSAMWLWLHVAILPSLLLSRLHAGTLDYRRCQIDYQVHQDLITACVMAVFWLPEVFTVVAYIMIALKMKKPEKPPMFGAEMAGLVNSKRKRSDCSQITQ